MFNPNEKGIPITRNPIPPPALSGSGSKGIISASLRGTPFHSGREISCFLQTVSLGILFFMVELNFLGLNVDKCEMVVYICFYRIPNCILMDISNKYVITINREIGSGGKTIGKLLAEKLGVPLYDRAHLSTLEDKEGLNVEEIERLKAKKRTWWPDFKRIVELDGGFAVSIYDNLPNFPVPEKNDTDKKFKTEQEILEGIADAESCVVVGRCSFVTFKNHPNHINIWIQSPMQYRVGRVMKKKGITSEKEAEKFITEVDNLCEDYAMRHTGQSRYNTRNYDLVISMHDKTEEEAVDLILKYIG